MCPWLSEYKDPLASLANHEDPRAATSSNSHPFPKKRPLSMMKNMSFVRRFKIDPSDISESDTEGEGKEGREVCVVKRATFAQDVSRISALGKGDGVSVRVAPKCKVS